MGQREGTGTVGTHTEGDGQMTERQYWEQWVYHHYSAPPLEYWEVTDGKRVYRCEKEDDAKWLCDLLNNIWG